MDNLALETLSEARKLFPREQGLIIEELNIYLTNQEFDKAQENLILAADQDPTNEILWFSLGSVQDELGETDAAIENYGNGWKSLQTTSTAITTWVLCSTMKLWF